MLEALINRIASLSLDLAFALAVAAAFVMITRGIRRTRIKTVVRALFTPRIWLHKSALMDYQYAALNIFVFPLILGLMILTTNEVGKIVASYTTPIAHGEAYFSETQARIILGIVLFFAADFASWLDHYLSHKIPFLWEFHKVHHSAEVLTPLTNYRVHPVDSLYYYNIKALVMGLVYGAAIYIMNTGPIPMPESTLLLIYKWLYGHLQHSQLWISFPGIWGKIFFSPAHHQIHHSVAKIHHNKNFGMSLAIFDWMFGTLHVPTARKQQLKFGVSNDDHKHQLGLSLIGPMEGAWKRLNRRRTGGGRPKLQISMTEVAQHLDDTPRRSA